MVKTSEDGNSAKCFSGILRQILCSGSLPTHPSDQFMEPNFVQFDHSAKVVNSPGIVARLMGLDSLPDQRTFGSFLRSRSVSSLDNYMPQLDKFHHRRVRTSASFREIMTFDQEKPEVDHMSCNCRRSINETKTVDVAKTLLEVSAQRKLDVFRKQNVRKLMKPEEHSRRAFVVESKLEKMKQKNKSKRVILNRIQPLFNSEDSSPKHIIQAATPAKSSPKFTNFEYPNYAITSKVEKSKEINREVDYNIKAIGKIRRLTEEAVKESCWIGGGGSFMFEDLQDLCLHFGQEVLELLINQVVQDSWSS